MSFLTLFLLSLSIQDKVFLYNANLKETRTKIAIIDTGIKINDKTKKYLCNGRHYDFTQTSIEDTDGHGTNIAGIIAKQLNSKKSCLLIIKYYTNRTVFLDSGMLFNIAIKEKVKFVNYSAGGLGRIISEQKAIQKLIDNKVHVSVAAGNDRSELTKKDCYYYPACYNFKSEYFHVVGNGKDGKPQMMSNYGEIVTDWRNGFRVEGFEIVLSGTSQATAIKTGELARSK